MEEVNTNLPDGGAFDFLHSLYALCHVSKTARLQTLYTNMLGERAGIKFAINDAMKIAGIDKMTIDVYGGGQHKNPRKESVESETHIEIDMSGNCIDE